MDLTLKPAPTAARPLLGQTVLLVEDSRFAGEAMRLLCLRSGARMRRADTLAAAHRHLRVFAPSVAIVDMGLPDGSGAELIERLSTAQPRPDAIIGLSGDEAAGPVAMAAGADAFLAKPITDLAAFQSAVLAHLPAEAQPPAPRLLDSRSVEPDPDAYADDIAHAASLLADGPGVEVPLAYVSQFLEALAVSAGDDALRSAARDLAGGAPPPALVSLLDDRMTALRAS